MIRMGMGEKTASRSNLEPELLQGRQRVPWHLDEIKEEHSCGDNLRLALRFL